MDFLKLYEDFNIKDYMDYFKPIKIDIDPHGEEDWEEMESGDLVYYIDKYMNIDIKKNIPGELHKYKKLEKRNLIRDLIIIRNIMVDKNKIKNEGVFRRINDMRKKKFDELLDNGEVENSNIDFTLDDIKSGKIEKFDLYYIDKKSLVIDKYTANTFDAKDDELMKKLKDDKDGVDDWWSNLKKHAMDIRISTDKITYNILQHGLGLIYFTELKSMMEEGGCFLGTKNVKERIIRSLSNKIDSKIENEMKIDLEDIKKDISKVDDKLNKKIDFINKRFFQ